MGTINVLVPHTERVTMAVDTAHMGASRSDLLDSRPFYDRHRDGEDALPVGTPHTQVAYTGGTRITLDDSGMTFPQIVFLVRAHASEFQPWFVAGIEAKRMAQVPAHLYDWDCRHCKAAVMTDDITDPCPHCLLK